MRTFLATLALLLFSAIPAIAQTPTPAPAPAPQPIFSCMSAAVALHLNGVTNAGADATCSFNLTNNFIISSDNILVPAINFEGLYAGVRYNINSLLSKQLSKTNVSPSMFNPYIHAAIGVARNVPATGPTVQHISALIGAGFDYDTTNSGRFAIGPRVEYLSAPGFGKSPSGYVVSANL